MARMHHYAAKYPAARCTHTNGGHYADGDAACQHQWLPNPGKVPPKHGHWRITPGAKPKPHRHTKAGKAHTGPYLPANVQGVATALRSKRRMPRAEIRALIAAGKLPPQAMPS